MERTETITTRTESEIIRMLIHPDNPENSIAGDRLHITEASDTWTVNGGQAAIRGYLESKEGQRTISILIKFPGFLTRSINKVRGRDPEVFLHLSIDE